MILTSDINLYNSIWESAERKLKDEMGLFDRLIDIFVVACSIGIKEDKFIDDTDTGGIVVKSIGRNTYQSLNNTDLKDILDYMLQIAIINSKYLSFDKDERLKLAFDPDYKIEKFSPASFLVGFANYGIGKIMKTVKSDSTIVAIGELFSFFTELTESKYDDILNTITIDSLK